MTLKAVLNNVERRKIFTSLGIENCFSGHRVLHLLTILTELLRLAVGDSFFSDLTKHRHDISCCNETLTLFSP